MKEAAGGPSEGGRGLGDGVPTRSESFLLEEGIGFAGVAKVCSMAFRRLEVVDVLAKSIVVALQCCVLSFLLSLGLFRCAALLCQVMCSFELPFWCQGANLRSGISCCLSSKCSTVVCRGTRYSTKLQNATG